MKVYSSNIIHRNRIINVCCLLLCHVILLGRKSDPEEESEFI